MSNICLDWRRDEDVQHRSGIRFKQNTFEPKVGHKFQLSEVEGYDQNVECEVTELDEPNKLEYTWFPPGVDGQMSETVVTCTLTEVDGGTSLNLVQSGFRADAKQELGGARGGWQYMLSELENVLAEAWTGISCNL